MLNNLVNIGFGNFVNSTRVLIILRPDPAPVKRLKEEARAEKRIVDATYGRRTRAVIITDSNHVILSSIQPETIAHRFTEYSGQNFKLKENITK